MTASATPPGFYATTAQSLWGSAPLSPLEAKSLIPAQLQQGASLYRRLFPPPPPGSFWQQYGPIVESLAVFAAGAAALSMLGTAAATAASASGSASTGAASVASATSASSIGAAPGFALTTGLPISSAPSVSATLSSLSYAAPTVGDTLGVAGIASTVKDAASHLLSGGVKSKLMALTKNLIMSQLPVGTQLSPSDQALMDNIIQGKQAQFAAKLESGAPLNYGTANTPNISKPLLYGLIAVGLLKITGLI